ncbi:MAG: hypothetical protein PHN51_01370 [Candidatus Nanopelagicales bacterium]|nr:hypothetical protein [Candidatus Nanopelagicales bacterium]
MKTKESPLLPMLRSRVQGDMLAMLFLDPDRSYSLTDLAHRSGASVRAIHAEANRLVEADWVHERRVGNNRMLQANSSSIIASALSQLLLVTYGPLPLLTDALIGLPDISRAYIYGSWAARHEGLPGPAPQDIDVLVVGTIDLDLVHDAVEPVAQRLKREVNIRRVSEKQWRNYEDDPFLKTLHSSPLVELSREAMTR